MDSNTQEQRDTLTHLLKPIMAECGIKSFKVGYINPKFYYEIYLNTDEFESELHPVVLKPKVYFNKPEREAITITGILCPGDEVFPRESQSAPEAQAGEEEKITFDEYVRRLQDSEMKEGLEAKVKDRVRRALDEYPRSLEKAAEKARLYGSQRYVV